MEEQSEANQTTQNQVIIVFNDIKTAVRTVRSPVGQVPDSADLRVGAQKVWIGSKTCDSMGLEPGSGGSGPFCPLSFQGSSSLCVGLP